MKVGLIKATFNGATLSILTVASAQARRESSLAPDLEASHLTIQHCIGEQKNICLLEIKSGNQIKFFTPESSLSDLLQQSSIADSAMNFTVVKDTEFLMMQEHIDYSVEWDFAGKEQTLSSTWEKSSQTETLLDGFLEAISMGSHRTVAS